MKKSEFEKAVDILGETNDYSAYVISYLIAKEKQKKYNNYDGSSLVYGKLPDVEEVITDILTNLFNIYHEDYDYGEDTIGERLNNIIDEAYCRSYLYEGED